MDKLKNYITDHRADFEEEGLPEGHAERFRAKLAMARMNGEIPSDEETGSAIEQAGPCPSSVRRVNRGRLAALGISFAAAAAVALLFLLRMPGGTEVPGPSAMHAEMHGTQAKEEFEELRMYYTMQINDMMAQIENLYQEERTPGGAELLKETKKVLHDNYMFEETVLPTLPRSNNGLFAISLHYNNSLESLSIMLREMERMSGDK